ncbi:hypothetical protein JAAARDRAFT_36316 [Jaapia argillacea MUCL 33604]|uniref:Uncharacterized protein n=1 Tax=Jaapia argillacea MUCL 33604 TaxID=933084 RepID=A0A067Q003_9AGAM|nr:hypothetical protein JAAARDRAFT_36316 [Jaapia argillacea MUCL 33604]
MIFYGFPVRVISVTVEWAWQHPHILRHGGRPSLDANVRCSIREKPLPVFVDPKTGEGGKDEQSQPQDQDDYGGCLSETASHKGCHNLG